MAHLDARKTKALARKALAALVAAATKADGHHALGVSLKAVTAAVDRLTALLPPA